MATTIASKAQSRAMRLLSIESDGTYEHSAGVLASAGYPADGVPSQHTWRSAGKLSDEELTALLRAECTMHSYAASTADTRTHAERVADRKEAIHARRVARAESFQAWIRGDAPTAAERAGEGMSALDDTDSEAMQDIQPVEEVVAIIRQREPQGAVATHWLYLESGPNGETRRRHNWYLNAESAITAIYTEVRPGQSFRVEDTGDGYTVNHAHRGQDVPWVYRVEPGPEPGSERDYRG